MFDTNSEGRLDGAAYQRYLRGIGAWGTESRYTDAGWDEEWPKQCGYCGGARAGSKPDTGVTREGFKALYIEHRATKVAADLASCRANGY